MATFYGMLNCWLFLLKDLGFGFGWDVWMGGWVDGWVGGGMGEWVNGVMNS